MSSPNQNQILLKLHLKSFQRLEEVVTISYTPDQFSALTIDSLVQYLRTKHSISSPVRLEHISSHELFSLSQKNTQSLVSFLSLSSRMEFQLCSDLDLDNKHLYLSFDSTRLPSDHCYYACAGDEKYLAMHLQVKDVYGRLRSDYDHSISFTVHVIKEMKPKEEPKSDKFVLKLDQGEIIFAPIEAQSEHVTWKKKVNEFRVKKGSKQSQAISVDPTGYLIVTVSGTSSIQLLAYCNYATTKFGHRLGFQFQSSTDFVNVNLFSDKFQACCSQPFSVLSRMSAAQRFSVGGNKGRPPLPHNESYLSNNSIVKSPREESENEEADKPNRKRQKLSFDPKTTDLCASLFDQLNRECILRCETDNTKEICKYCLKQSMAIHKNKEKHESTCKMFQLYDCYESGSNASIPTPVSIKLKEPIKEQEALKKKEKEKETKIKKAPLPTSTSFYSSTLPFTPRQTEPQQFVF